MAIALVQKAGTSAAAGTVQVTLSSVAAGNAIIILAYSFNDAVWSITDSNGTPVQDVAMYQPNLYVTSIWSVLNTNSGSHVFDLVGGNVNSMIHAWEISGLATSSAFDKFAVQNSPSVFSMTVGPTGTTTVADELVIGCGHGPAPGTFSSSDAAQLLPITDATYTRDMASGAKIVSATGTQTLVFTATSLTQFEGVMATYKIAGGGGGGGGKPALHYARLRGA